MALTSDNSSEDDEDDDDIYIGSAARLKALMKKGPPTEPADNFDSSIDCERDIFPPVCTSSRATAERRRRTTRNSCKARSPLASLADDAPKKITPSTESITLDDSDESDACVEEKECVDDDDDGDYTIDVKVRWKSRGIVRLKLKTRETFDKIFKHFAKSEGVSEKRVLLLRSNKPLLPTDTPASVSLRVIDILEGGIVNTEVEHEESKDETCRIKVQMSTKGKIVVDLRRMETFGRVVSVCAEKLNVAESQIKLSFDGEEIEASETPESLELEDEACIDLRLVDPLP